MASQSQRVNLALIIKNSLNNDKFIIVKQPPPPKFNDQAYDSYKDSDLWDLPSAQLPNSGGSSGSSFPVKIETTDGSSSDLLNSSDFDSALNQIRGQVGFENFLELKWALSKVIEEPEFGPGIPFKTIFIIGEINPQIEKLEGLYKWIDAKICADMLLEVKPCNDRIGPLVVIGLMNDSAHHGNLNIPPTLRYQEYPPGVKLIPMKSRTSKPFQTTNFFVFVPETSSDGDNLLSSGDALIVDPGCYSSDHKELEQIVTALPRKLVVFVTHHHRDHVDGLSVVQKCNPDATLLAHENTFRRISKGDWSLGYTQVVGSEEISIGGQLLRIISAPGHTDGHMALLHISSNSLIVGDHCVGQGSAFLDTSSGGNMSDYFHTTYKFLELSPHMLIPMHGRVNMWPKHMLCGYLKNRRNRESTILKATQNGTRTLFDIVAYTYADVERRAWIAAASNVKLHVEHLAQQDKLPEEFSMEIFNSSFAEFPMRVGRL